MNDTDFIDFLLCKIEDFGISLSKMLNMLAEKIDNNTIKPSQKNVKKIPKSLIWEVLDGQPLYRKGYKEVMRKLKTIDDIMGTSSYQSIINSYLLSLLFRQLDISQYDIMTNEVGIHFDKNDNASNDIAIYERLKGNQITKKYANYPAKIVIEIDIDIDPDSMHDIEYLNKKTQKLLDFGTEKVIWILTNIKKVMIATHNNDWLTVSWDKDIEILKGITFNIENYLIERDIKI